ncbi:tRNA pseudouridine(13) synthase TruD [Candidatus Woesearchaeota archaeon]|nr:tRNA pseudouridine(13) synthase TruD [Candidatus Woesearchaeota archaeon]
MYKIKQIPEDFVVKEKTKINLDEKGSYSYFLLKKKNYTTEKAISVVAEKLGVRRKYINYAGNKDRNAVTEQTISINSTIKKGFEMKDLELKHLGRGSERVNLGSLEGNEFEIIVRNLDEETKIPEKIIIPNYFDEQRFSRNNVEVGRLILKKRFKEAVEVILANDFEFKEKTENHLERNNNDYVGALKLIPKKILSMYINSVQSLIFNNIVAEYLKEKGIPELVKYSQGEFVFLNDYSGIENRKIPLPGFCTEKDDAMIGEELKKQKLTKNDFLIRQIPEISSEGTEREMLVETKIEAEWSDDQLNEGKKKVKLSFFLPKGSYATIVVKSLFP